MVNEEFKEQICEESNDDLSVEELEEYILVLHTIITSVY